jgi:hypothetical protein
MGLEFNKDSYNFEQINKQLIQPNKDTVRDSIKEAIDELNGILQDIAETIDLKHSPNRINNLLYYSLIMLIDELEYIRTYIEKIEESIDISVFDTAKKLNDSIVNLIGHRKDILFKLLETSCKIQEYLIKWKKLLNDTTKNMDTDGEMDWIKSLSS